MSTPDQNVTVNADEVNVDATTALGQEGENPATGEGNGGHDADDANTAADAPADTDGDSK